jgi:malate dehydrogenase (oxaloacetate-decarboxylating)
MIMVDSQGVLHKGRSDLRTLENQAKWHMCEISNREGRTGGISEALRGADVCIALSRSGPGTIRPQWIAAMARDAIVFACANPVPEIWPWEAEAAGARLVATGRSDFPNQVNNSLGFPAIFRGVLDVAARKITDEMCIAAAEELSRCVDEQDLSEAYILPRMDEWEVFPRQAAAVGLKAIEQGVARIAMSREALFDKASRIITRAREETRALMEAGIIATTARA